MKRVRDRRNRKGKPTPMRDAGADWRRFDPRTIPSKEATPHLDEWLRTIRATASNGGPPTLLDVGCGTGQLSRRWQEEGFSVVGVDINPTAVAAARAATAACGGEGPRFAEADFAADRPPDIPGGPFDVVVCQLVISIIGGARQRRNLLRHAHACLRPDGWLFLSASGVSDTVNAGYARLYATDAPLTGEPYTYFSRDEQGTILYVTHHFTAAELEELLREEGFTRIKVTTTLETSSRRPGEAACFHHVTCRAAASPGPGQR